LFYADKYLILKSYYEEFILLGIIKPKRFFAEVNTIIKVGFAITQKKIIKSPLSRGDLGVCFIAIYSKNKVIP